MAVCEAALPRLAPAPGVVLAVAGCAVDEQVVLCGWDGEVPRCLGRVVGWSEGAGGEELEPDVAEGRVGGYEAVVRAEGEHVVVA